MNFAWWKLPWYLEWCDPKYNAWGSPTCPQEPHSHTKGKVHSVNYHKQRLPRREDPYKKVMPRLTVRKLNDT